MKIEKDYNELDRLFKEAFERIYNSAPDEHSAWKKFQRKRNRSVMSYLILPPLMIALAGFFYVSNRFSHHQGDLHILKPVTNDKMDSAPTVTSTEKEIPIDILQKTSQSTQKKQIKETIISNVSVDENPKEWEEIPQILSHPDVTDASKHIEAVQRMTEFHQNTLGLRNMIADYQSSGNTYGKKFSVNLSLGYMLHNHFIDGGNFMGGNHPGLGVQFSGVLRKNIRWNTGFRYVHRGNQDLNIFSKTREIYDVEQINIYTLYVQSNYWLEIPLGIQYYLNNSRTYIGGAFTADILLYQSAILGMKTQIPSLNVETDERRKRASNYDAGIPGINPGFRTELGWIISEKNSIEIFTKLSPYGGVQNANIDRFYGWDIGFEWKYYF
jgi:hypothetical protein